MREFAPTTNEQRQTTARTSGIDPAANTAVLRQRSLNIEVVATVTLPAAKTDKQPSEMDGANNSGNKGTPLPLREYICYLYEKDRGELTISLS